MRKVHCVRLGREADGLPARPIPGELGEKIYNNVSQQAWGDWLKLQTMIINENQLTLTDPKARELLMQKMEEYLFEGKDVAPTEHKS